MSIEILNVEMVGKLIDQRGWKTRWVIAQLGEKPSFGYPFLRDGGFPKDPARKAEVLENLAKLLGVQPKDLIVTLRAKTA